MHILRDWPENSEEVQIVKVENFKSKNLVQELGLEVLYNVVGYVITGENFSDIEIEYIPTPVARKVEEHSSVTVEEEINTSVKVESKLSWPKRFTNWIKSFPI